MNKKYMLLLLAAFVSLASFSQIYDPVKWKFELKATSETTADLVFKASIEEGWHLYGMDIPNDGPRPTTFVFESVQNAKMEGKMKGMSKLREVYDPNFDMKLSWYANEAVFVQKISFAKGAKFSVKGYVEFMSCNDESCTPPMQENFVFGEKGIEGAQNTVAPVAADSLTKDSVATTATIDAGTADYWTPVMDQLKAFGNTEGSTGQTALWLIFLAGLLGGFLALFTPCVWPIIPMTVSFFLKRSDNKARGRRDAFLYGLAIVFIYVALGILITLIFGASALNSMSTNAVFNLIFFAMLLVFAISFFGAFEITLPASWSTKLDAKADSTAGFLSILFMAFTLVLVSFSCTGPIIGTLLVEVSATGSLLAPAIGMLGFAVALAIPFTFFAFFPTMLKSLPRSGGWLNTVKVVLAFLELALALKFL
ncbi:MAG: thiol:disulfide interchange protein, partial [Paludibacter sp.]|nr:thiol:disulfide interchange protein [Paludibacter sp.]